MTALAIEKETSKKNNLKLKGKSIADPRIEASERKLMMSPQDGSVEFLSAQSNFFGGAVFLNNIFKPTQREYKNLLTSTLFMAQRSLQYARATRGDWEGSNVGSRGTREEI